MKCGAGGGNRTIRAYSFYVTYCKHTNARTAQPAVCPPPMYKIMYNEIGRCGVAHRLRYYEHCCTCALASSALLSAVSLARAQYTLWGGFGVLTSEGRELALTVRDSNE